MKNAMIPTGPAERLQLLDVTRGFALFGIMFVNMTWFTGFAVLSADQRMNLGSERIDNTVYWLIEILVAGKFWTIFAFLFGVGAAIQYARFRGDTSSFRNHFFRRLTVLMLIGLTHAIFLWFGDIVSLYAATGLVLLIFISRSNKTAIVWGCILLVAPIVQMAFWLLIHNLKGAADTADPGHGPAGLLPFFATGSYAEAFAANWAFLNERWLIAVYDGRFLKLSGLFLMGWWAGNRNVFANPSKHRRLLCGVFFFAVIVGLPLNVIAFTSYSGVSQRPPSAEGWILESLKTVGFPALALGYIAGLSLYFSSFPESWITRSLALVGRLSLTNYVSQSVIGVIVFYGYGFQQWGRFGVTWSILFILIIFALQIVFSWAWLRSFRYGPLEWVWRCLTYNRFVPLRIKRDRNLQMATRKT